MEFKFRAVDDRMAPCPSCSSSSPSFGNFSEQAENVRRRQRVLEEEMTQKLMMEREMPNPKDFYTIQLEIEKEKIGQELFAAENVRRRLHVLEEEVTRKLVMEREVPMRRLSRTGKSIDESLAFSGDRSLGFGHNVLPPILAQFSDAAKDEIKSASPFPQKDKLIMLARPNPNLCGAKRKVTTPPAGSQELSLKSLKKPKEWSCALCQVSATCEQGLNVHLQSKKHKAKEAGLLRARKMAKNPASQAKKSRKRVNLAKILDGAGSERKTKQEEESSQADKAVVVSDQKMESIEDSMNENEQLPKQKKLKAENQKKTVMPSAKSVKKKQANKEFKFWCDNCQVGTHTADVMKAHKKGKKHAAVVMEAHRKGKKHVAQLKESNENGKGVSMTASPMIVEKAMVVSDLKMEGIDDSKNENEKLLKHKKLKAENQKKNVMPSSTHSVKKKQANKEFKFWCENCQVGTHTADVMEAHKKGKKHVAQLKEANENGKAISTTGSPIIVDKAVVVSNQKMEGTEDSKNENGKLPKQEKLKAENQKKNVVPSSTHSVKKKQGKKELKFWCENCQVGTHTADVMEAHKKGKKHVAQLKEANENGKAISTTASPMIVDKAVVVCSQKMEGTEDSKNEIGKLPKQENLKAENQKKNVMKMAQLKEFNENGKAVSTSMSPTIVESSEPTENANHWNLRSCSMTSSGNYICTCVCIVIILIFLFKI